MELFELVERSAILIRPRQPFLDWLSTQDPEMLIDDDIRAGDIYLIPAKDTIEEMEKWLKKNHARIFEDLLSDWYLIEETWPIRRTFSLFKEWFDFTLIPIVCDTQRQFINKI